MEKTIFALRLKELREVKEISQYKLAEILNLSRSVLSNYEQGIREPDFKTVRLLANYFNVSTDYLLGVSEVKHLFLSQEEMKYYSGILSQINDIKELNIEQITDLLKLFNTHGEIIDKIKSLSDLSVSELKKYLDLLKIRDSVDDKKEANSVALKKQD